MKEYIEREAVLDAIKSVLFDQQCDCEVMPEVFKRVQEVEADDVAPVRHGRWKNGGNGLYDTCSACGKEIYLAIPMNYCPECGAMMDGKEDKHEANRCG